MRGEQLARPPPALLVGRQGAAFAERSQIGGDGSAVAALQLEQQPLEIARHLNVHAGAEARHDRSDRHLATCHIARQNVVAVSADHQPLDRQSQGAGEMPGIDIAEIAGRHAERHRPPGIARQRAERKTGGNVINDLRRHPRKIDRVDG